jgi:hypothetical protein
LHGRCTQGQSSDVSKRSEDPIPRRARSRSREACSVEVTFEESRAHLGVETQRQWSDLAIARTTPALFGLFSVVTLVAGKLDRRRQLRVASSAWYDKSEATFSDCIGAVRRQIWSTMYLENSAFCGKLVIFPRRQFSRLLNGLLAAA